MLYISYRVSGMALFCSEQKIPKIILDSNILISGLVFKGEIGKFLDYLIDEEYTICTCSELQQEVTRTLKNKFDIDIGDLEAFKEISRLFTNFKIQQPFPVISRDKNDNFLLALIEESGANILITGDKDLLVLKSYNNCKIIKISEFLAYIKAGNL
jgi:putative PIN family toxin of toxin-antitoxin system